MCARGMIKSPKVAKWWGVLIKFIHRNFKQTTLKILINIKSLTFGGIIFTEGAVDEGASY